MDDVKIKYPVFIFSIALLVCIQNIWGPSIYILDEAKNATCAREMMESADHIVPTFNYELRTDKPPLHYYFIMLSYKLFGVNAFSARFFSAVFGALTVLMTFLYTRKFTNERTALLAAITLITSTHFALQFHLAVPDPYLVFFLTLAGFAFIDGFIWENKRSTYLAYIAIGLGILAKGPVAIAIPGFTVAVFIVFSGRFNWKTILGFRPFTGLALALLIAAPWYVAVGIKTDWIWLKGFFLDHNIDRFAEPKEGHGGKFWLTLVFVVGGMLPMSVYVFQSFKKWWQMRKNDFLFFCGLYVLVVVVFFAIADTKLPNYTVPAYPFMAVLIAFYLDKVIGNKAEIRWFAVSSAVVFAVMFVLPFAIFLVLQNDKNLSFLAVKSFWLLPLSLFSIAGIYFLVKKNQKAVLTMIGVAFLYFTSFAINVFYPLIDATNPVAQILPLIDTNKPIAHYQRFNASFAFYLKKPIPKLETPEEVTSFFKENPDGILITRSDFAEELSGLNFLKKKFEEQDLFETKKTVVFVKKD